jgi:hypothetical protein
MTILGGLVPGYVPLRRHRRYKGAPNGKTMMISPANGPYPCQTAITQTTYASAANQTQGVLRKGQIALARSITLTA